MSVTPPFTCNHAGVCGGCSAIDQPYGEQLRAKQARLQETFADTPSAVAAVRRADVFLPVDGLPDPPTHFRQKVSFVFGEVPGQRRVAMGHYQRGSRRIVPVVECPVHSERGNRIAFALYRRLAAAGIGAAGPMPRAVLRHLIIRTTADDREAIAMLVVTRNDKALRGPVRALLESPDAPDGMFINIHDEPGPYMVGPTTLRIAGRSHVRETVGGVSYLISPTAFFQTNVRAAHVLQAYVVGATPRTGPVLDLYCGSGMFALPLAAAGVMVTGVEENRQAIADAEVNARFNRISKARARFLASRVEDAVGELGAEHWNTVILDPTRHGCADAVLEAVFQEMAPPNVIYVSCNPEALAAELPGIMACGYTLEDLRAVDMFPHTDHLEVVARLSKRAAGGQTSHAGSSHQLR